MYRQAMVAVPPISGLVEMTWQAKENGSGKAPQLEMASMIYSQTEVAAMTRPSTNRIMPGSRMLWESPLPNGSKTQAHLVSRPSGMT